MEHCTATCVAFVARRVSVTETRMPCAWPQALARQGCAQGRPYKSKLCQEKAGCCGKGWRLFVLSYLKVWNGEGHAQNLLPKKLAMLKGMHCHTWKEQTQDAKRAQPPDANSGVGSKKGSQHSISFACSSFFSCFALAKASEASKAEGFNIATDNHGSHPLTFPGSPDWSFIVSPYFTNMRQISDITILVQSRNVPVTRLGFVEARLGCSRRHPNNILGC